MASTKTTTTTTTKTKASAKAKVEHVALRRQIQKQAPQIPADWGRETPDATLMLHGVKAGVFASLEHLPLITAKQAAQLANAADVLILDDSHAIAINKASGREYRKHDGNVVDIGTIDPLALPEGFRAFFKAMLKKRHESAACALHYCTKGLRKQARNNKADNKAD